MWEVPLWVLAAKGLYSMDYGDATDSVYDVLRVGDRAGCWAAVACRALELGRLAPWQLLPADVPCCVCLSPTHLTLPSATSSHCRPTLTPRTTETVPRCPFTSTHPG